MRECASDKRALFSLIGGLMGSSSKRSLPTRSCDQEIADDLGSFFSSKVSALVSRFAATETSSFSDPAAEELTRPMYPLMEKTRSFSVSQQCMNWTSSSSSDTLLLRRAV